MADNNNNQNNAGYSGVDQNGGNGTDFSAMEDAAKLMGEEKKPEKTSAFGKIGNFANKAKDVISEKKQEIGVKKDELSKKINENEIVQGAKQGVSGAVAAGKAKMKVWAQKQAIKFVEKKMHTAKPSIKKAVIDPDMCKCVKRMVGDIVDDIWPDIEEEVLFIVSMKMNPYHPEYKKPEIPSCLWLFWRFRAWFRYTHDPVDMTFWKQIKTVSFWVFKAVSLLPFYGVQPMWFTFTFLMMDKADEYQLIKFILAFKGSQFITQGIMKGLIGFAYYYSCVNFAVPAQDHSCIEMGPGAQLSSYWLELFAYLVMVVVVWSAFFLLPCSKVKGQTKIGYQSQETQERNKMRSKGGRLKYFMMWDLFAFISTFILFAILQWYVDPTYDWQVKANFFWVVYIYGLLSFPFLFLTLPIFKNLLTHSRPTAYNSFGQCVPLIDRGAASRKEAELKEKEEKVGKGNAHKFVEIDSDTD